MSQLQSTDKDRDLKDELIAALFERGRLAAENKSLREALRGMVELVDHLHAYPKANPRKFFFLSRGGEHGNICTARAILAKVKEKT